MSDHELLRAVAEAAVALDDAKDRIHYLNEALLTAQERVTELEKLCAQQKKVIAQMKETLRQGKYVRLSEHRRSL